MLPNINKAIPSATTTIPCPSEYKNARNNPLSCCFEEPTKLEIAATWSISNPWRNPMTNPNPKRKTLPNEFKNIGEKNKKSDNHGSDCGNEHHAGGNIFGDFCFFPMLFGNKI